LVFPIAFKLYKIKNKESFQDIKDADIAYLLSNNFSILFRGSKAIVIGSTHCWDPGTVFGEDNKLKRFIRRLEYRRNSRAISGYHVFPSYANYLQDITKKYNFTLGNGVDTDLFHPKEVKNDKVKFLFLANLNGCKGTKIVIDAWKRIKDKSNMELHIAGGGPLSDYVKEEARAANFTYHGILPLEELANLYRSCDVFIYPTNCDMLPLVVLEATSSGLYVITSTEMKNRFDDFEKLHYLEYQPRDPETIAKRMEEIAKDKDILNRDRMKQYQYVKDNYSWEIISNKLFDFFFEVAKKEGKI
jgi:glycosyltransferase involved in cell wall biosynthesis